MTKPYQKYASGPWAYPVDTSIEGADKIAHAVPVIAALVLTTVADAGLYGTTVVEMATRCGVDRMGAQPRFTELRIAGKIVDSGKRRKNPSGVNAIVWTLPDYATRQEAAHE